MELQHLRTFVKVAEYGSLTQAAETLCLSQPAVSAQIKLLEDRLNIILFRRASRGMILTEAGKLLLKEAAHIVLRADGMVYLAARLQNKNFDSLRLGIIESGYHLKLPRLIGLMTQQHPEVEINVISANSGSHLKALLNHKIDMAFIESEHIDGHIRGWQLGTSRIGIIGPIEWQAQLREATWPDLAEFPWIFQGKTCSYYKAMMHIAEKHDVIIKPKFQVEALGAIRDLVAEGLALSVIDLDSVENDDRICIWPGLEINLPVWLVALEDRAEDPSIQAFAQIATTVHRAPLSPVRNGRKHLVQAG